MLVTAAMGAVFSLLLSFASINLRADQTIGGTALNLMAPALVLFLVRIIANQNTLQLATGDSATLVHDQEVHLRHRQKRPILASSARRFW